MQLAGEISGDISSISELENLDLSYNKELGGPLPASIGDLKKLKSLMVVDCSFSGPIPDSIGSLQELEILALNSNKFTESIPPSIGNLSNSNLTWLDLTDNKIDGSIPVSSGTTLGLGLDKLFNAEHFHLGKNQLSGEIPPELFSSEMTLIHLILDNNKLSGDIPSSIGVIKTLEVISFDSNSLTGPVPASFSNLINLTDLCLSNNELAGPFPNLTGMISLANLIMEGVQLQGQVQIDFSSFPNLQTLVLSNNKLSGIFDISSSNSDKLQLVDLLHNLISDFKTRPGQNLVKVILEDNPFCRETGVTKTYCTAPVSDSPFGLPNNLVPQCSHPYSGRLIFRVPLFLNSGNSQFLTSLKQNLSQAFKSFPVDSFSLSISTKDSFQCNSLDLNVCFSGQDRWNRTIISQIGSVINEIVLYNPFYFNSDDLEVYLRSSKSNSSIIIGAAVGGSALLLLLLAAGLYAYRQKKRAVTEAEKNNPFAHWDSSKNSGAEVPRLKEAKGFSFEELKRCTNNFSEANEIGNGGYGKVYRGVLPSRRLVAIKRAKQVSVQGGVEFKNEIELLSRVHHKNLVSLLGFCFDRGEHMIVYEFVPNGSLHDSLSGKTGIRLDWVRRLKIALGAARGLAYMHELADPPIIHRDIKSNNILLDERLVAKVADFGLSKPISDTGNGHVTTQVKGTMGYLDPEFYMTEHLTEKSDVYSFGVVMLELLTGRKPLHRGHYIVRDVRLAIDRTKDLYNLHELLDPSIGLETTLTGLDKFVDIAMKCVEESGTDRPTMGEVVKEIEHIFQLAGLNPNAESASSSASYEETSKISPRGHPYYQLEG